MFLDFEEPDNNYPVNGSLEEKAAFSMEQQRRNYYWAKRTYETQKEGGPKHTAILMAIGPKAAENMAKASEEQFAAFCANCLLTKDGETTDPKYPVDKMINAELRRIRQVIILSVSNFMYHFDSMMPDDLNKWTYNQIYFNLEGFKYRYIDSVYEDINVVIPNKKLPPRSVSDLEDIIDELAVKYSSSDITGNGTRSFIVSRMRDIIIEFLLVDIPFNNRRLEQQALVNDTDALKADKKGDKPILH